MSRNCEDIKQVVLCTLQAIAYGLNIYESYFNDSALSVPGTKSSFSVDWLLVGSLRLKSMDLLRLLIFLSAATLFASKGRQL